MLLHDGVGVQGVSNYYDKTKSLVKLLLLIEVACTFFVKITTNERNDDIV